MTRHYEPSSDRRPLVGTHRTLRAPGTPKTPESSNGCGRAGAGTPKTMPDQGSPRTPVSLSRKIAMFSRSLATSPKVPSSASLSKELQRLPLQRRRQDSDERSRQVTNLSAEYSRNKSQESQKMLGGRGRLQEPPGAARGKRLSNEQHGTQRLHSDVKGSSLRKSKHGQIQQQHGNRETSNSMPPSHSRHQQAPAGMLPKDAKVQVSSAKPVSAALLKKLRESPPDDQEAINAMFASDVPQTCSEVEGLVVHVNTADEESCGAASEVTFDAALMKPRRANRKGRRTKQQHSEESADGKPDPKAENGSGRNLQVGKEMPKRSKSTGSNKSTKALHLDERMKKRGDLDSAHKAAVTVASTTVTRAKRRVGTPPTASTLQVDMSATRLPMSEVTGVSPQMWTTQAAGQMNAAPVFKLADGKLYQHPPMPPGWSLGISRSKNRPYYFHPDFGTTFYPPVLLPTASGDMKGTSVAMSRPKERLEDTFSSSGRNEWETPLSSGNDFSPEQGGNVPSSAFLVSVAQDTTEAEPDNSRETPFLFRSIPTAPMFSAASRNVPLSSGHSGNSVNACGKDRGNSSSTQSTQVESTPLESTTEILIAAKCARIRKAREEAKVENVAEASENWSIQSLYPASDRTSASSKLSTLWETPVVYDGSNSGQLDRQYPWFEDGKVGRPRIAEPCELGRQLNASNWCRWYGCNSL